jgi:FkbM family methyltransferase
MIGGLAKALPISLKVRLAQLLGTYSVRSYSQEGEDMILGRIFDGVNNGFYIDVGAHHPMRFSNTYAFYKKGWRGINIEAMPESMRAFRKTRPRDINVEAAVALNHGELTYYVFNEPALNTFNGNTARERTTAKYRVVKELSIHARPLSEILGEHVPENQKIDFMSVDVEGLDLEVVRSNDWQMFRAKYVLVESYEHMVQDVQAGVIHEYMLEQQYGLFAKTVFTLIYEDQAK